LRAGESKSRLLVIPSKPPRRDGVLSLKLVEGAMHLRIRVRSRRQDTTDISCAGSRTCDK